MTHGPAALVNTISSYIEKIIGHQPRLGENSHFSLLTSRSPSARFHR